MQNLEVIGRWLVVFGILVAVTGGILWLLGRIPGIQGIPGTIKIEKSGITCLIPLLASILLSVVLTVLINVIIRIGNK
jgi:hypothetical protein